MDRGKLSLTPAKQLRKRELVLLFPQKEIPGKKKIIIIQSYYPEAQMICTQMTVIPKGGLD